MHGVGGSHGARMLGYESATDAVTVGEGVAGTAVLASRSDRSVESYDWGNLTSGTGLRALWVFLLPFTLVNIAGWMHPPVQRTSQSRVRLIRSLVHLLSVLMTATYVFSLATIVVDLCGWQWSRRLAVPKDATKPLRSTLHQQQQGVILGLLALLLVLVLVVVLAGRSQEPFEKKAPSAKVRRHLTGNERWGNDERLDHHGFFHHPGAAHRLLIVHGAVLGACWLLVAGLSLFRAFHAGTPRDRLDVGQLLGICSALAIVALALLFVASLKNGRRSEERWTPCAPAIAAGLGFALVNAVSSGALLLLFKRLNDWPKRPNVVLPGPSPITPAKLVMGPDVALVDVWGFLLIVLGLAAAAVVGFVYVTMRGRPVPATASRTSDPGCQLDGADPAYMRSIAKSRLVARLAHRSGWVALGVVGVLFGTDVVVVLYRSATSHEHPFFPGPAGHPGRLFSVGAYVLPLLILFLMRLVSRGRGGARTIASTLWDVLTFWPRRFSPLAVRPYSERAVPELQGRTIHHVVDEGRPLVLRAHSQGSILAFAALAPLAPDDLRKVALVTYGSPISTIFATFFPAYFGTDNVEQLRAKLPAPTPELLGWRNFYRLTDPIGGPVFLPPDGEGDCQLPDPFDGVALPGEPPTGAPLEHDRPVWSQLAVHSYYEQEPVLKTWVGAVKTALATAPKQL